MEIHENPTKNKEKSMEENEVLSHEIELESYETETLEKIYALRPVKCSKNVKIQKNCWKSQIFYTFIENCILIILFRMEGIHAS